MDDKIIPFSYRPITQKKRVFPLLFTLLAISGILVILSVTAPHYRGIISLAAVAGLCASMYLGIRFASEDYIYNVTLDANDEAVFLVGRIIGKRITTMLNIKLYSIKSIEKFTKDGDNKYKPTKTAQKLNYIPSFRPDVFYVIYAKDSSCEQHIFVEITDEVSARLLEYARLALIDRSKRNEDE